MPPGRFRMIGFLNANQQGSRLSAGSIALVRWLAEFAPNSATLGSLVDQRLQLSSRIRCSGLLSPEAADFVLELADAGSGLLGAGKLVLVGEDGPLRRWVDPE